MAGRGLPDRLQWTREASGDQVLYASPAGLRIRTEAFLKADSLRILPLGSPQGALMNHLLCFPEAARGKRVFEPFAGSGALGLAALLAGAAHADLLDVNPRAQEFQRGNAAGSGIAAERITPICADVAEFTPERPYDLLLANPPFVPTPDGIDGSLTSNGGADGNRFVEVLFERLETFLAPTGRALIYVFQIVCNGRPLVADRAEEAIDRRPVALTPTQQEPIPLAAYAAAYLRIFPQAEPAIARWRADVEDRHGNDATLCHYVVDVGPRERDGRPTRCTITDDLPEKFGEAFWVPARSAEELALGRVFENVIPPASSP